MANTKNNQNRTNKSGKLSSSAKGSRKKKNSSDDTMKFLLVLVIAGIAIALIFFSQKKEDETEKLGNTTPTPAVEAELTGTVEPTAAPTEEPGQLEAPTATPVPTSTPIPTPVLSAEEAEEVVAQKVDATEYNIQLVNPTLIVGNGVYYQFGAIKNSEFVSPFLAVSQADGSLHFYDSTEGTIYDFTKFPLTTATPTPTPEPEVLDTLTAKQAYEVLCTYSKDALHIAKEVKEYEAEYGDELTLIAGVDCYRINLSEFSNGKVRNRGEFYVSVDGKKCFYIDSDTNEFVEAVK